MMDLELIDVSRKTFRAKAVRVTEENLEAVADWCGSVVVSVHLTKPGDTRFVRVPIMRGARKSTEYAFVGDWITLNGEQFKVYKHASFMGTFDKKDPFEDAHKQGKLIGALVGLVEEALQKNEVLVSRHDYPADELLALLQETAVKIKEIVEGEA